jgi:phosphatidylglycerol:prolipoprotein diacylglycerol transferase
MDPYLIEIGSFRIGYYGLMYIVGAAVVYALAMHRRRPEGFPYDAAFIQDYMVWAVLGLALGARAGYVLFYNLGYYVRHPLEIVLPFSFAGGLRYTGIAGMSYHGGVVGLAVATFAFLRRRGVRFAPFADFMVPCMPLGYTFGRIGNFINGELYGRVTARPWGMYFPAAPGEGLRHPSQLYEAAGEGLLLFAVLWALRKRLPAAGMSVPFYLIGYGLVRFLIEFVREPDAHLGAVLGPFSMGQALCLAMIAVGLALGAWLMAQSPRPRA